MADLLTFALAVVTLLLVPGPTNTVMAAAGANGGGSPLPLLAGELAGYATVITLATLVLLPVSAAWPVAAIAIKLVVAAYLVFAAWRLWRRPLAVEAREVLVSPWLVYVTTTLNPKGLILAVAVFPQGASQMWVYALVFAVLVLGCGFAWFTLGRVLAKLSGPRAAILPRVAAIALMGFAALVASTAH